MDSTNSISESCFVFKPKSKGNSKKKLTKNFDFVTENWYKAYNHVWNPIEDQITIQYNNVLSDLHKQVNIFVHSASSDRGIIPTIILLTGVNMSDHEKLFQDIDYHILNNSDSYTATLFASDCLNIRSMIESMVQQFLTTADTGSDLGLDDFDEDSDAEDSSNNIKRANCTLPHLVEWYENLLKDDSEEPKSKKKKKEVESSAKLIIILPDFGAHSEKVITDFILIMSNYASHLPIIFMFGVASTISAVHDSLPSHVISKLSFEIFDTPPSINFLNSVVNSVFLRPECPFQLSGSVFRHLKEKFLYYDFSLNTFIRSFQYCVMDHFFESNVAEFGLKKNVKNILSDVDKSQIQELEKIVSFATYVKRTDCFSRNSSKKDKRKVIHELLNDLFKSIELFYLGLHCLNALVQDLPGKPLGSNFGELYTVAMCSKMNNNPKFLECMKLLNFTSKSVLLDKIGKMRKILKNHSKKYAEIKSIRSSLKMFRENLDSAALNINSVSKSPSKTPTKMCSNRGDLFKYVEEHAKRGMTEFDKQRKDYVNFLCQEFFGKLIIQLSKLPFNELVIYNNLDGLKEHMTGTPRASLFKALTDPHFYLQCECCQIKDYTSMKSKIIKSMPDVCIVYKLHLQWGTLVNVFDWMTSFAEHVDPDSFEDPNDIAPDIQARFMQAVADLQFLGYIKQSTVKKDHVARLTTDSAS